MPDKQPRLPRLGWAGFENSSAAGLCGPCASQAMGMVAKPRMQAAS
jgi:hypothetical protein